MATVTRVHGTAHGVVHHDTGTNDAGAGVLTSFIGTAVDCFKILVNDGAAAVDMRNELDEGEAVEAILREVETKATVLAYQVEDDANGQISVMVEGTSSWTAATLQTAIRALGSAVGSNSIDVDGSTVTDSGFKLA